MFTRIAGKLVGVVREEAGGEGEGGGGGGAGGEVTWRDELPEDMRSNAGLADFSDVGSLAKSFLETKSMVGNSIRVPGEDAGDEARAEFNTKLLTSAPNLMEKPNFDNAEQSETFYRSIGMPEKAEGYNMPEVEGMQLPEERSNLLKAAAHKAGISANQFSVVMQASLENDAALMAARETQRTEAMQGLRTEWGMAFDDNYKVASSIAAATGAPASLVEAINGQQAGPEVIKWLHGLSAKFGPEGQQMINQGSQEREGAMTPADAKAKADEIMNNKAHPYWDPAHPGNADAIKKMIELRKMANPS